MFLDCFQFLVTFLLWAATWISSEVNSSLVPSEGNAELNANSSSQHVKVGSTGRRTRRDGPFSDPSSGFGSSSSGGGYGGYGTGGEAPVEKFDGDVFNTLRSSGLLCTLCVVSDSEFKRTYARGDTSEIQGTDLRGQLEKLVDAVSWLWRSIDWNGDNFPDNIGFSISRFEGWDPFPGEDSEHYNTPRSAMSLLSELGLMDFSDCCLGLGFTMRPFTQKQVGVSLVASRTMVGGICDYRRTSPNVNSRNVMLITGRGLDGQALTSQDLEQVLLHELGHAFGVSKHDNELVADGHVSHRPCSGHPTSYVRDMNYGPQYLLSMEPPSGRFIMWSNNQQGRQKLRWNNLQFSPCSKADVAAILRTKRTLCLKLETTPFCGNGILEDSEVCDCGNEFGCRLMTCCTSKRSSNPCQKAVTEPGKDRPCHSKYSYPLSVLRSRSQQQGSDSFNSDDAGHSGSSRILSSSIPTFYVSTLFLCFSLQ